MSLSRRHSLAIEEFQKSIHLNPSLARAQHWLGLAYVFMRRPDDAISQQDIAIRLSPNDPLFWGFLNVLALAHFNKGEFEKAADWAVKATLQPNCGILARVVLTACLARLERQKEADEALKSVFNIAPKYTIQDFKNAYPFLYEEDVLPWVESLRKAGMPDN